MNRKALQTLKPTLKEVQGQFRIWRKTRKKRTSIPKELMESAIELTQHHPIYTVSKALGLSYTDFKKRVQGTKADVYPGAPPMSFVEVEAEDVIAARCIVEMETARGERLKMDVMGKIALDLVAVAKAFLETTV